QSWILMPRSPSTSTSNVPFECIFTSTTKRSSLSAIFSLTKAITFSSIECATRLQTTNHEKRGLQLSPLFQDDAKINKIFKNQKTSTARFHLFSATVLMVFCICVIIAVSVSIVGSGVGSGNCVLIYAFARHTSNISSAATQYGS